MAVILLSWLATGGAFAHDMALRGQQLMALPNTAIDISGVIVSPAPCIINSDKPVDVEFDILLLDKVDGKNYSQSVPVSIVCPESFKGEIKIKMSGEVSLFNNDALATSKSNLGLMMSINGKPMAINQFYDINWRQQVEIKTTPVKNASGVVETGEFTASATLLAIIN